MRIPCEKLIKIAVFVRGFIEVRLKKNGALGLNSFQLRGSIGIPQLSVCHTELVKSSRVDLLFNHSINIG
jgi:hypothetical protein